MGFIDSLQNIEDSLQNVFDARGYKSCPYCGKFEAQVEEDYINSFIVVCCNCTATSRRMYSAKAALSEWNKRC